VFRLIVVRDSNLRSGYGALGVALDINMVFEVPHDSKPKECFSCIAQARLQIVTMPSWMPVSDVSYTYIKVQVSIIDLMLPKKSSQ
jgi:hypothetical protein